jgi:2-oxoglutarate ferredoxin oxidoreductase subunit delta
VSTKYWRKPFNQPARVEPAGVVHIIADRCKGCGWCIEFCPRSVLKESADYNRRGYHPPDVETADYCVECRLCELICPEFAIYVTAVEAIHDH